jgi:hypothetical protein
VVDIGRKTLKGAANDGGDGDEMKMGQCRVW